MKHINVIKPINNSFLYEYELTFIYAHFNDHKIAYHIDTLLGSIFYKIKPLK